eukprot:Gregarina_sp_Pseudo_9__294@NODE_118_length_4167_cov_7_631056_g110_i0_p2_GENE_NODE_118_length_4167_cov_7_631056_g110_i0NODE_118_length_4167_cov_7_631056_g110_i0_p2_ORF_typecomplete_len559_score145_11_NODE_118_length_4167_cov_7_631056_g110_i0741750
MDEFSAVLLRELQRPLSYGVLAVVSGSVLKSVCLSILTQIPFNQVCCQGNELLEVQCGECAKRQYRRVGVLGDLCAAGGGSLSILIVIFRRFWHRSVLAAGETVAASEWPRFESPRRLQGLIFLWLVSGSLVSLAPILFWVGLHGTTHYELGVYGVHFAGVAAVVSHSLGRLLSQSHPPTTDGRRVWRGPPWAKCAPLATHLLFAYFAVAQPLGNFGYANPVAPFPEGGGLREETETRHQGLQVTLVLLNVCYWLSAHLTLSKRAHLVWLHAGWCAFLSLITCGTLLATLGFQDPNPVSLSAVFSQFGPRLHWALWGDAAAGLLLYCGVSFVGACSGAVLCAASRGGGSALGAVCAAYLTGAPVSHAHLFWRLSAVALLALPVALPRHFVSLTTAHHLRIAHTPRLLLLEEGVNRILAPDATDSLSPSPVRRYMSRAHSAARQAINEAVKSPLQSTQTHLQFSSQRSTHSDRQSSRERRYYTHPCNSLTQAGNSFTSDLSAARLGLSPRTSLVGLSPRSPTHSHDSPFARSRTLQDLPFLCHPETDFTPTLKSHSIYT